MTLEMYENKYQQLLGLLKQHNPELVDVVANNSQFRDGTYYVKSDENFFDNLLEALSDILLNYGVADNNEDVNDTGLFVEAVIDAIVAI